MTVVYFQSTLTPYVIESLIPDDYKQNEQLYCIAFNISPVSSNVLSRLKVLHQYMPQNCWESLLVTEDAVKFVITIYYTSQHVTLSPFFPAQMKLFLTQHGKTPLMHGLLWGSEMDDEIMSLLTPQNKDLDFWRMLTRVCFLLIFFFVLFCLFDSIVDREQCNMLHLSIMNKKQTENNLKCLRAKMPKQVWNELLQMKNYTIVYYGSLNLVCGYEKYNVVTFKF
ncbi:hypothetical protein RFI_15887 [Reticulomyxa filosa]|uniref:Uncharacterized protein n=1 Tax=Reticulomyxa filosa TaxID=46433 RepID=X6N5W0_RETFI|nr:hypothetical protein RFI_15887 [Reticulomyxa filosa]|eukprot:ETO21318.1 hypothetical protein RFI_15887 [Reticulomyxa filosa]